MWDSGSVASLFDTMRDAGLTVGRFFGHGHKLHKFQLQYSPGGSWVRVDDYAGGGGGVVYG